MHHIEPCTFFSVDPMKKEEVLALGLGIYLTPNKASGRLHLSYRKILTRWLLSSLVSIEILAKCCWHDTP